MKQEEKYLKLFDYRFPDELIAQKPASPRDSSRLLVYNRKTSKIRFDRFSNIVKYLPQNSVLVFNQTKVIPARLEVKKATGGRARILYVGKNLNTLEFIADRKLKIGSRVSLSDKIFFTVKKQKGRRYFLAPSFKNSYVHRILEKYGQTPLPPYIKNSPLSKKELKERYQTVFAKKRGSVAAPTASLHFTKNLIKKVRSSGVKTAFLTLHVNLGTFAAVTEENLKANRLHEEFFEIDPKTAAFLNQEKRERKMIIPVGTTSMRALESASGKNHRLKKLSGSTNLFIHGKYDFRFTNGLITNFHVPKSSLLMLVASFVGRKKILDIYQKAIRKKFRLFSFGDVMLIL